MRRALVRWRSPDQCVTGAPCIMSAGLRTKNAPTTAESEMIAPTRNAARMPAASAASASVPAAASVAVREVITVMNRAVPAAPATCWIVPTIAEPCE